MLLVEPWKKSWFFMVERETVIYFVPCFWEAFSHFRWFIYNFRNPNPRYVLAFYPFKNATSLESSLKSARADLEFLLGRKIWPCSGAILNPKVFEFTSLAQSCRYRSVLSTDIKVMYIWILHEMLWPKYWDPPPIFQSLLFISHSTVLPNFSPRLLNLSSTKI